MSSSAGKALGLQKVDDDTKVLRSKELAVCFSRGFVLVRTYRV